MFLESILFVIFCSLLTHQNVETQTLEATSAIVQKRFAKNDYLSGKEMQVSQFGQRLTPCFIVALVFSVSQLAHC